MCSGVRRHGAYSSGIVRFQFLLYDVCIMHVSPSGPKVVSKVLTMESIEELREVLKRPPVIWDNLHANDYDQKRLYMGPYSGRLVFVSDYLYKIVKVSQSKPM